MKNNKKNKMDPIGNFVRNASSATKWTALFAVIAVFSIMAVAFAQVSFAMPDPLPDTIVSPNVDAEIRLNNVVHVIYKDGASTTDLNGVTNNYGTASGETFPVYCLEHWLPFRKNTTWTKSEAVITANPGVVALLMRADSLYGTEITSQTENGKNLQAMVQIALWCYLSDSGITPAEHQITNTADIYANASVGSRVKALVDYATANETNPIDPIMSFEMSSKDFALSEDGNYMVSQNITISGTPADSLSSFTLNLTNAPEGTIVTEVTTGGETDYSLSEVTSHQFTNGSIIKVKVPKDKLTEETKTFTINASGTFTYYGNYEYVSSSDVQKIITYKPYTRVTPASLDLNVSYKVSVPNTAKDTPIAFYIIGGIVLLSGIGVIYANVRPKKATKK